MSKVTIAVVGGALLLGKAVWAMGQDPAPYVSRPQSGTVRYVKGKQLLLAGGQGKPVEVAVGHQLKSKDFIQTHIGERLEFMLQPRGFLRLVGEAQLEVLNTAYREMHFRVVEGTVVIDSADFSGRRHSLKLSTPAGQLDFRKDGFYRIHVRDQSSVEVAVHSGKLNWLKGGDQPVSLNDGKRFLLSASAEDISAVSELVRHSRDFLDPWGQELSAFLLNGFWGRPPQYSFSGSNRWLLTAGHELKAGGELKTLENGRAELLLNPGSYLRVAESSRIRLLRTGYAEMNFEILQGEIIVESGVLNPSLHSLSISTPGGDLQVVTKGLYRIRVEPRLRVSIHKGALDWIGRDRNRRRLKAGRSYGFEPTGSTLQPASLNGKDDLNDWSRQRARQLAQSNSDLSVKLCRNAYPRFGYQNRGGWVLSDKSQWFTFVPFDSKPRSPYGFRYRNALWIKSRDLGERRNGRRQESFELNNNNRELENNATEMGNRGWDIN